MDGKECALIKFSGDVELLRTAAGSGGDQSGQLEEDTGRYGLKEKRHGSIASFTECFMAWTFLFLTTCAAFVVVATLVTLRRLP